MITIADIRAAQEAIHGPVLRTPMLSSNTLGRRTGYTVFLKAENLQKTGSFKTRGALNKVRHLSPEAKERGLIAVSAGNHAQAVAYAATAAGVASTVVMPEAAPIAKVEASRTYGAEIILHGSFFDAFERCEVIRRDRDLVFVHPFDDEHIIAGQGTVGLEIVEDFPDVDAVLVCVGGGGLIAGIATAVKSLRPATRVIGVEPVGAACLTAGLEAGRPVQLERVRTIADGLATPSTGEVVLEHVNRYVDDVVLVTDEEMIEAIRFLLERVKLLAEPAGAAAVAALLAGKIDLPAGARVAVTISGGNMDLGKLPDFLPPSETRARDARYEDL